MVRTYVRKTDRGSKYSHEDLEKALQDITTGLSTLRGAARKYNIPEVTLRHHRSGRRGKSSTLGRRTVIPLHEEEKLANGLKVMERWGWGLSRKELLEVAGEYVKKNKITNPFKNGIPGEDWFLGFKKRHRLSVKQPQSLEYARKKCTDPFTVGQYFKLLKTTLDDLKLQNKPSQIFNIDETNFCLDPSKTKVVGEVNRPSSRITSGPGRENVTVLLGGNAAGQKLPPLIVFKGKSVWDSWLAPTSEAFPGTSYASSKNGWMETEIFANYFKNVFLKNCGEERPIILLYDGHTTHVDISVVELAMADNVVILKLPAHTSHLLQPMDLAVFKGLKTKWDAKLVAWQRTHVGVKIPKRIFSVLIGEVWSSTSATVLQSGFKKAGIYPYDCNVVPKDKYDPEVLRRYEVQEAEASCRPTSYLPENPANPTDTSIPEPTIVEHVMPVPGPSTQVQSTTRPIANLCVTPQQWRSNQSVSPSGSAVSDLLSPRSTTSFEEVLLQTVKQNAVAVVKRKKVSTSEAEVITSEEVAMRLKQMKKEEDEKTKKKRQNEQNKIMKRQLQFKTGSNLDFLKCTNKRKEIEKKKKATASRQKFCIPTDSDSDPDADVSLLPFDKLDDSEEVRPKDFKEQEAEVEQKPKPGSWVLARFATKTKVLHFVGQILSFDDIGPVVKFIRKKGDNMFYWPEKEDCSVIPEEDVLKILPEPTPGRRGELIFDVSLFSVDVQ